MLCFLRHGCLFGFRFAEPFCKKGVPAILHVLRQLTDNGRSVAREADVGGSLFRPAAERGMLLQHSLDPCGHGSADDRIDLFGEKRPLLRFFFQ